MLSPPLPEVLCCHGKTEEEEGRRKRRKRRRREAIGVRGREGGADERLSYMHARLYKFFK